MIVEPMLALKASAVLMWLVAASFGVAAPFVASYLLRERVLPTLEPIGHLMGGGFFGRFSPEVFAVLLGLFAALSALEAFAAWLLWQGEPLGGLMTVALLPVELVFWAGFGVPVPLLMAIARIALLAAGWSSLR